MVTLHFADIEGKKLLFKPTRASAGDAASKKFEQGSLLTLNAEGRPEFFFSGIQPRSEKAIGLGETN
jgi:hypothetical protein